MDLYRSNTPAFVRAPAANRYTSYQTPVRPETPSRANTTPRELNRKPSGLGTPQQQWTAQRPTATPPRVQSKPSPSVVGRSPAPSRVGGPPQQLTHRVSFNGGSGGSTVGSRGTPASSRVDNRPHVASKLSNATSSPSIKLAPPRQSSVARLYAASLYTVPEPEEDDDRVIARIRTPVPQDTSRTLTRTPSKVLYPTTPNNSGHKHVVVAFKISWEGEEGVPARILLDPGASVALVSKSFVKQNSVPFKRRDSPITIVDLANRTVPDSGDAYTLPLTLCHQYHWTLETFEVAVMDERIDAILPLEWMDQHELVPLHSGDVYFGSAHCMQHCTKKQILKDQEAASNAPATPVSARKTAPPPVTAPKTARSRVPAAGATRPTLTAAKPLKLLMPQTQTTKPLKAAPRAPSVMGQRPSAPASSTSSSTVSRRTAPPPSTVRSVASRPDLSAKKSVYAQPTRRTTMPVGRPAAPAVTPAPQTPKKLVRSSTSIPSPSTTLRFPPAPPPRKFVPSNSSDDISDDFDAGYDSSASSEFDEHPRSGFTSDRRHEETAVDEID